jgi:hypothetical protein
MSRVQHTRRCIAGGYNTPYVILVQLQAVCAHRCSTYFALPVVVPPSPPTHLSDRLSACRLCGGINGKGLTKPMLPYTIIILVEDCCALTFSCSCLPSHTPVMFALQAMRWHLSQGLHVTASLHQLPSGTARPARTACWTTPTTVGGPTSGA